ncbi:MAG: hypothetical protein MJ071_07215 [Oscillospiraceae bacterium]|nr:hypothetical protein [Oscillospiraceae bacterium]
MEFSENTKVDHVTPEWAQYMQQGDFISYMPSFQGGDYLDLFEERICKNENSPEPFHQLKYYLYRPMQIHKAKNKKYPLLIFIHGATNALDGKKCVGHSGAEMFASPEYQERMGGGAFLLVPLANEKRNAEGNLTDSWCDSYCPLIKKMADEIMTEYGEWISSVFVIGGSSGGYMSWAMAEAYPDFFTGVMPASADYIPPAIILEKLQKNNVQVVFAIGKHDEFGSYSENVILREAELHSYDNIICYFPEWVRNGDGGIASLYFGIEMGQHCMITQIQADLRFDDGTPYCASLPDGVTGWVKSLQ